MFADSSNSMDKATISEITRLSPDVRQYVVELDEGDFDGLPGHHTVISKPDGGSKPYSALAVEGNKIVLTIRNYGGDGVSHYMSKQEVGSEISLMSNLRGNLTLEDEERPIALISTGVGVTPMIGILNEYVEKGKEDAVFMFGEKNTNHLLYKEMLEQYEIIHNVSSHYVLSREAWRGREGYVQEHIEDVVDDCGPDTERDFYVCGVPVMVVQTKEHLKNLGVPEERIHSEGWEDAATN